MAHEQADAHGRRTSKNRRSLRVSGIERLAGAWVPHVVLVEACWVLTSFYKLKPPALATAVAMLLSHRQLTLQEADVVAAALGQFRRKPALSFSDCLVLETARKAGHLPLGTFDGDLSKLEGAQRL